MEDHKAWESRSERGSRLEVPNWQHLWTLEPPHTVDLVSNPIQQACWASSCPGPFYSSNNENRKMLKAWHAKNLENVFPRKTLWKFIGSPTTCNLGESVLWLPSPALTSETGIDSQWRLIKLGCCSHIKYTALWWGLWFVCGQNMWFTMANLFMLLMVVSEESMLRRDLICFFTKSV